MSAADGETWRIASTATREFSIDSAQNYPAQVGDAFEIRIRIRVDTSTKALPELVCYDALGRELPVPSSLTAGPGYYRTDWQEYQRIFPAQPGTAQVRARIRATGHGEIQLAGLQFHPAKVDPYKTGALIAHSRPGGRRGLTLAANQGIVNTNLLSDEDRDGDGKWAVIDTDLDEISRPEGKAEDWRTSFQYRPNEFYWFDGTLLKSDSVLQSREPDLRKALHFRARVREGQYRVTLNDLGRAAAVSLDGKTWKRVAGGSVADIGIVGTQNGNIDFWLDACYRDPVSAGPVYFDSVSLVPVEDPDAVETLFAAARQNPPHMDRGSVEEKKVGVTVSAPRFVQGRDWPVRSGLPIPRGELADGEHCVVLNQRGEQIPSQNRVLATWPDGSVKWLFLDFQQDFSKSGGAGYTVVYGNGVRHRAPSPGVHIVDTPAGLEVDTGAIRFLVSRSRFGLLDNVRLSSGTVVQAGPIAAEVREAGGRIWRATDSAVSNLQVEQNGPLHAVILVETALAPSGQPASGFAHRARIHAYAGSPLVQVDYFVANTDNRPAVRVPGALGSKVDVRSISLRFGLASPITSALTASGRAPLTGAFVQKSAEDRQPGWVALGSDKGSLIAGVEAFAEQFPKSFRWTPRELSIGLWDGEGGDYEWIEGVGKTHCISLFYGDGAPSDGALLAHGPVLALASPEWYSQSGAFGRIAPASESRMPDVEQTLARHMGGPVVANVGLGFENYGDHSSSGYVKGTALWDNNEYDLPAAALVHFARTGDRDALQIGLASALHYLDVDTIHYSGEHADWARAQRVHSHGTFGHHTADGPNMHHAGYVQGLIWYSYLTGDPAGIEGARGIADWVLRNIRPELVVGGMERAMGHPLMTLNDVYEATWEPAYLRGSARLADLALKWEEPVRSGFPATITEWPAYYSGSPFCGGLLPSALMKFNSWAKLPEIDRMLERVARWTLTEVWRPPSGIQVKGGSARAEADPRHIASHLRLMDLAFRSTKDPLFLAVPRECMVAGFGEESRPFGTRATGLVFNYLPWFLKTLEDNGYPSPESELKVAAAAVRIKASRGGEARACFVVQNLGTSTLGHLRASFQPRLDFTVTANSQPPDSLGPGEKADLCYTVRVPERLNLSSESNRIAYAHWSAIYERESTAHIAHTWVSFEVAK